VALLLLLAPLLYSKLSGGAAVAAASLAFAASAVACLSTAAGLDGEPAGVVRAVTAAAAAADADAAAG
jgi:hypothetical protein